MPAVICLHFVFQIVSKDLYVDLLNEDCLPAVYLSLPYILRYDISLTARKAQDAGQQDRT